MLDKNLLLRPIGTTAMSLAIGLLMMGCSPRVGVEVPDKPITINLNVKIDHDVKVRVEKDLESVISKDSDLF